MALNRRDTFGLSEAEFQECLPLSEIVASNDYDESIGLGFLKIHHAQRTGQLAIDKVNLAVGERRVVRVDTKSTGDRTASESTQKVVVDCPPGRCQNCILDYMDDGQELINNIKPKGIIGLIY